MGYIKKHNKGYAVYRKYWWMFWQVDTLEFRLPTRYQDAYEEVERSTMNGSCLTHELMNWVKKDIREQLKSKILDCPDLVAKAKRLTVQFRSSQHGQNYTETMEFYLRGDIYFDSDEAIKRDKILSELGI
jgi:hypothetical protein